MNNTKLFGALTRQIIGVCQRVDAINAELANIEDCECSSVSEILKEQLLCQIGDLQQLVITLTGEIANGTIKGEGEDAHLKEVLENGNDTGFKDKQEPHTVEPPKVERVEEETDEPKGVEKAVRARNAPDGWFNDTEGEDKQAESEQPESKEQQTGEKAKERFSDRMARFKKEHKTADDSEGSGGSVFSEGELNAIRKEISRAFRKRNGVKR